MEMPARYSRSLLGYIFAVLLILIGGGCVAIGGDQRRQFAGGSIALPQGYSLREDRNRDTPVATGEIANRRTNLRIRYSCGSVFGVERTSLVFADPASLSASHYQVLWSKHSGVGDLRKVTTLAEDRRLKERKLYISFPNGGPANFVAPIISDAEIVEIQRVVGTFEPKTSKRGN
jgi:hypothetical protein